jgi:hypothetical protein
VLGVLRADDRHALDQAVLLRPLPSTKPPEHETLKDAVRLDLIPAAPGGASGGEIAVS